MGFAQIFTQATKLHIHIGRTAQRAYLLFFSEALIDQDSNTLVYKDDNGDIQELGGGGDDALYLTWSNL